MKNNVVNFKKEKMSINQATNLDSDTKLFIKNQTHDNQESDILHDFLVEEEFNYYQGCSTLAN